MTGLEAIILGIIEGAAEFLPISSTGHLILASKLLAIPDSTFLTSFEIAIQCGAILAVVVTYWRSFLNLELLKKIAIAFLPTALIGFTVYPYVKEYVLGNAMVVVMSLFLGGIALIVFELLHKEREDGAARPEDISYKQALGIGLFQAIAIIPGVSRSGATIVGGLATGIRRVAIVEFSFLLAAPTMAAATSYDLLRSYKLIAPADIWIMVLGAFTAFMVALIALKFLVQFVKQFTFIPFGIYRIVIAIAFFFLVLH